MTLNEYQELAMRTARTDQTKLDQLNNAVLGLCGESGEVADLYKKFAYQHAPFDRSRFLGELGDLLWYVQFGAVAIDATMEEVAANNLAKLLKRYPDGYDPIRANNREKGDV